MSTDKTIHSSGIGFCGLLTVAFIVLKLCGVIEWAWVWVRSPMWIPLACALVVVVFLFFIMLAVGGIPLVVAAWGHRGKRRIRK